MLPREQASLKMPFVLDRPNLPPQLDILPGASSVELLVVSSLFPALPFDVLEYLLPLSTVL